MLQVLSPTYTIRVEIKDKQQSQGHSLVVGSAQRPGEFRDIQKLHQFFEGMDGKTGCDEVLAAVRNALQKAGIQNVSVSLERFEHR